MIPTPPDPFEEWLRVPPPDGPKDSPFIVRPAQLEAGCKRFEPEIHKLENWQILPGDRDYH